MIRQAMQRRGLDDSLVTPVCTGGGRHLETIYDDAPLSVNGIDIES